jgi:hypothetical protein
VDGAFNFSSWGYFMFKKILAAAAIAALSSTSAFALTNAGFESGDTVGWMPTGSTFGQLTAVLSGADVTVLQDAGWETWPGWEGFPTSATEAITAMDGNYFGLLQVSPTFQVGYRTNGGGAASLAGDMFWMQLVTFDFEAAKNDSVTVKYYDTNGAELATDGWDAVQQYADVGSGYPFGGWRGYAVPVGTVNIEVTLENVGDVYNKPLLAIDYAPVPEPETYAMMLAGLGALGFMGRRRQRNNA